MSLRANAPGVLSFVLLALFVRALPAVGGEVALQVVAPPAYSDRFGLLANFGTPNFPMQDHVFGWSFQPHKDFTITHLGWWAGEDTLTVPHEVGIFDRISTRLLVSTIVMPSDPSDSSFQFAALDPPFTVEAFKEYVIAGHTPAGLDAWAGTGAVVTGPDMQYDGAREDNSTFRFPQQGGSAVKFGPNFKYRAETITTVDDQAGKSRFVGGEVRLGANLIGYFNWQSRELFDRGAGVLNSETLTINVLFTGSTPARNITLQGIYDMGSLQGKGGISAVSSGLPGALQSGTWSWSGARDTGVLTLRF
jgi:hypothetical protein